jgi:hypothetical protein
VTSVNKLRILSQIELYLDGSFTKEEGSQFISLSRCICGFVERHLAKLQFQTTHHRINIYCSNEKLDTIVRPLSQTSFLEVRIPIPVPLTLKGSIVQLQNMYAKILQSGLQAAQVYMPVPLSQVDESIDEFRRIGYQNTWVQAERHWKKICLSCIIKANVTTEMFSLQQDVYVSNELIGSKTICTTNPREFIYCQYLGKLALKGNLISYSSTMGTISEFDIQKKTFYVSP